MKHLFLLLVLSLSLHAGIGENNIPIPDNFNARFIQEHTGTDFEFTWSYNPSDSLKGFRITAESIATFDVGLTDTAYLTQHEIKSKLFSKGWEYRNPAFYYVQAIYEFDGNTYYSSPSATSSAVFSEEVSNKTSQVKKTDFSLRMDSKEITVVSQATINSLQLLSANGKVLFSSKDNSINTINIESVTPGIYFLRIGTSTDSVIQKVMIQ